MRKIVLASLALILTSLPVVAAEPYLGRWAADEAQCSGDVDGAETVFQVTPREVLLFDEECRIDSVSFDGEKSYAVSATCTGTAAPIGGKRRWKWEMADSQTMIQTDLDNPPKNNFETDIRFRCMASGLHPSPDE
jgi:hypothetical protein